jgi:hypothetical protein
MKKLTLTLFLLLAVPPALAFDVGAVKLGGKELDVKKAHPSAHCKPLEWKSDAADRRCDDARVSLGGVQVKLTAFLKADVIRAIDLRFETRDLERVKAVLRERWGTPLAEATETFAGRSEGQKDRAVFKMRWEKGDDRAVLTAQLERRRAGVEIARGRFADEIYRVK